jgi:hypothetical protein
MPGLSGGKPLRSNAIGGTFGQRREAAVKNYI